MSHKGGTSETRTPAPLIKSPNANLDEIKTASGPLQPVEGHECLNSAAATSAPCASYYQIGSTGPFRRLWRTTSPSRGGIADGHKTISLHHFKAAMDLPPKKTRSIPRGYHHQQQQQRGGVAVIIIAEDAPWQQQG